MRTEGATLFRLNVLFTRLVATAPTTVKMVAVSDWKKRLRVPEASIKHLDLLLRALLLLN